MTTTPRGRMEPTPGPSTALDLNHALLQGREQARAQWADGLAQFQLQMAAIAEASLPVVVQAAAPAFALGFSFSAQKLLHDEQDVLRVTLRHRSGAEEYSEALAPEEGSPAWQALTGSLLAGLLGIPVGEPLRTNEPDQQMAPSARVPAADGAGDVSSADDEWTASDTAAATSVDPGLEPLAPEEIETLHRFLAAMPAESRKRFTIEFRHHFAVPREVRTIKDRITQRRHRDFIDTFERALAGVVP